ncbi:MAG: ChbG/HpnK family deacetylase [Candidatus Saccharicenans sp.]|nr:ChbG/HpnK family deacetylase [Candidatus Saccharicenans sp.]
MSKQLIINADGFGFTFGVNRGIIETIEKGVVRSTSALANMPAIEEVKKLKDRFPGVSIGIHFNLSVGRPVSSPDDVPTLIDEKGEFLRYAFVPKLLSGRISFSDMVKELDNQVRRLAELGIKPTHFDGHQNKHLYLPFFLAALKVAKEWDIKFMRSHNRYLFIGGGSRIAKIIYYYLSHPQRLFSHTGAKVLTWYAQVKGIKTSDRLITPSYADNTRKNSLETWLGIMSTLPEGVNEIYCHPGYPDELLAKYAYYVKEREIEVEVLTSRELKEAIEREGIQLISFKEF